jgi:protein O-mannosyl-transferase
MFEQRNRTGLGLLAGATIFLVTLVTYLPVQNCGFIWDDDDYVTENLTIRDFDGLVRIWADRESNPQYYPLVHTSFWLEYQLWGLNPTGYHWVNVVLHAMSAFLLWRVLLRLGVPGSWFIAVIFAIHPVHVESVAWITERKNVLSGLFYLCATYCFLKFSSINESPKHVAEPDPTPTDPTATVQADSEKPNRANIAWLVVYYVAMFVFFIFALLSKTVAATFPAAMLVIVWWKRERLTLRDVLPLVPLFLYGVRFGLMTVTIEKVQVGASGFEWDFSIWDRILIAGRVTWFYFAKLIWPHPLIFTYPRWNIDDTAAWQYLFPVSAVLVVVALWFSRKWIGRGPLAAVLLFGGTLFPALGFFNVFPMRFSFVADHFQYLASIAMIALVVATGISIARKFAIPTVLSRVIGFGVIAVLMVLTWRQIPIYENLETLWRDTLAKNPTSWMAHSNLASLLSRRGDYVQAEKHLKSALELKPDYSEAHLNMGKVLEGLGRLGEAEKAYQRSIELMPNLAAAYNGLGVVYAKQNKIEAAKNSIGQALKLWPRFAEAHMNLGSVLRSENQLDAAIAQFKIATEIQPELFAAQYNLALAYFAKGDLPNAEKEMRIAVNLRPDNPAILMNLGAVLSSQRKYEEAIACFTETIKMAPKYADAYYNLGSVYKAIGNEGLAAENFRKANALRNAASQFGPTP